MACDAKDIQVTLPSTGYDLNPYNAPWQKTLSRQGELKGILQGAHSVSCWELPKRSRAEDKGGWRVTTALGEDPEIEEAGGGINEWALMSFVD